MIGRIYLRLRQSIAPDRLPRRVATGLARLLAEVEASILRPGESTPFRAAHLHLLGIRVTAPYYFSQGLRIYRAGRLQIGPRSCFGENTGIYVHGDITIGSDFLAAPGLTINNGIHDFATLSPSAIPLKIGDRVWCGVNVTLVAGASLGDDCIIGANSLVKDPIPPRSLAVGSPARVVRRDIRPVEAKDLWSVYAS